MEFLYVSGWRSGEALGLQWANVDLAACVVRIEDSKNEEPRTLPYSEESRLVTLFKNQRERTDEVERATGQVIPWVWHAPASGSCRSARTG